MHKLLQPQGSSNLCTDSLSFMLCYFKKPYNELSLLHKCLWCFKRYFTSWRQFEEKLLEHIHHNVVVVLFQ